MIYNFLGFLDLDSSLDTNFLSLYVEFFLLFSICVLIAFLVIIDYFYNYKIILSSIAANLTLIVLFLSFILVNNNSFDFLIFNQLLIQDNFNNVIKSVTLISLISCIIFSYNYLYKEKIVQYEYFLLLLLSLIGLFTIINSNDLITMYLGIELQSLSFYILASFKVYNNFSTEAGLKYFILGAFSSGLLLLGCSLIYGFTGTTQFNDLYFLLANNSGEINISPGILVSSLFLSVGILFKLGAAPFHMWLPDIYDGVPTSITAIFAILPKIAILTLLLRLSHKIFSNEFFLWHQILIYSAVLSILIGTMGALYQSKVKKLLAYSAISHIGFILIGLVTLNSFGLFSLLFYILTYIIISINIFATILGLRKLDNNVKIKKINEFNVLFKSNKILAINFGLILFSITGIPPLAGFYSKFYIFISAIQSELYIIAIFAAIISVIASMYYIRLIKLMFFKQINYWTFFMEMPKKNSYLISLTLLFNMLFFCYPEVFVVYLYKVALYFSY